jgi:D-alanyl-D-alanine carboxypeptidase (penicillin-binding protein 5/6)
MKRKPFRIFPLLLAFLIFLAPFSALAANETQVAAEIKLNLPCKSAILIEETTGQVLYEMNADERLPIASVTKIMTLLLVMEALDQGTVSLTDKVPISEYAASMGGSQVYLAPGEDISLEDVLKAVFVSSANDGAVALGEMISGSIDGFVAAMNEKAASLGMHNTIFYNPTGLDDLETNLSTARDVSLMSAALMKHKAIYNYSGIWIDSIRGGTFGLSNTNKLIRFYPGATGLKTGSTGKAKYCVSASAKRNDLSLCAVVLAGETSADRFQAAKTLLDHGFANWSYVTPEKVTPQPIRVWGGKVAEITPSIPNEGFLLPKSDAVGLQTKITLPEELNAPLTTGETIGLIEYKKGDTVIHSVPITIKEDVPALSFSDVFRTLLFRFFTGSLS